MGIGIVVARDDPGSPGDSSWDYPMTANELVAVDGIVCGTSTSVFSLDAATGEERFVDPVGEQMSPLSASGETLLALVEIEESASAGAATELRAYALDGERRWTVDLAHGFARQHLTAPVVAGDVVAAVDGTELRGFDVGRPHRRRRVRRHRGGWPIGLGA